MGEQVREKVITNKDLNRVFWLSWFIQSAWNYERMMGHGFAHGMLPIERKLRKSVEELKEWIKLHLEFYNTEPHVHNVILGMTIALEEAGADPDTIRGVKTSLMGPFAGLGDSVIWFTILPIVFTLGASLGAQGNFAGPILSLILWIPITWAIKYYSLIYGYRYGTSLAEILRGETLRVFREYLAAFGMLMVGGITATYVRASTPLVIARYGENVIRLQPILDSILPKLLPLLFTIFMYLLLRRGWSLTRSVLVLFLVGFVLGAIGVLG